MAVPDCPLCAMVSGTTRVVTLRCWPDVIAVQAPSPRAPGHVLLIATDHFDDVAAAPHVAGVVMVAAAELAADYPCCTILATREEARAGDEPPHLHLDLIPRAPSSEFVRPGTADSLASIRGSGPFSRRPG